ncbi:ketopantoate reductase PanE/ApbA C terminal-domain-containing protein [Truncatella angustata]|uniref:Ketopantoate reductase PanE/ApbA C terminal-domain-containing protein n=1 Tax=Truncatella angustata TaxID=152316 RepID=A0A9P8RQ07_9PEZI|nr:ketopantoate reductase PanE/ApbA C terminal-domain-containing protein [Truncatella angustata]KAH6647245.1 ketopantoate reductase PanE/ApbA C terminal-domain-containing protein [Truncatella angustata]
MASRQSTPDWLQRILDDSSAPPKLYSWTSANLSKERANQAVPKTQENSPKKPSRDRIHVLGIGNMGRLFASSLAKLPSRPPITLVLHRKALLEQWVSSPGIEITRSGEVQKSTDFDVEWWTDEKPHSGPVIEATSGTGITNLIVATKASDALPLVDRLRRYLDDSSTVAFTQNGMCKMWPPVGDIYTGHRFSKDKGPNWIACITTHGVVSLAPFRSRHASVADVLVGPVSLNAQTGSSSNYLTDQIVNGPDLYGRKVSKSDLWVSQLKKLVVNSVINPLTALLRCRNGDLFLSTDDEVARVIDMLILEASEVLKALIAHSSSAEILEITNVEHKYDPDSQQTNATMDKLHDQFSFDNLRKMVYDVGHKVRENTSSMLQDVRAGKPTEIRDFNGWLVETGELLNEGLDLPSHKRLIGMVENGLTLSREELGDRFGITDGQTP